MYPDFIPTIGDELRGGKLDKIKSFIRVLLDYVFHDTEGILRLREKNVSFSRETLFKAQELAMMFGVSWKVASREK
jgi:hypothetical protein